jgi:AcrR family transcriptional regulator
LPSEPASRPSAVLPPKGGESEPGKAEVTRQGILEAAARIFRRDGYAAARLTDIAAEVGMKAGSLYYHFGSREALVEEVMAVGTRRTHQAVKEALAALPRESSALARLEAAIRRHLVMVLAQEDIASATIKLIWQAPQAVRHTVLVEQRAYGDLWRDLLREAAAAGAIRDDVDLSVVRMAIMGALNWAADWYSPAGRRTPEEVARDMAAMFLAGLAPRD